MVHASLAEARSVATPNGRSIGRSLANPPSMNRSTVSGSRNSGSIESPSLWDHSAKPREDPNVLVDPDHPRG